MPRAAPPATADDGIATGIGRALVEKYAEMEQMITEVAQVMGTNRTAVSSVAWAPAAQPFLAG